MNIEIATENSNTNSTATPNFSPTQTVEALLTNVAILQSQEAPPPTQIPLPECIDPTSPYDLAQVIRVIDGDTIEVIVNGSIHRLRYIGIDTPELDQQFGSEAALANSTLVANQTITIYRDVSEFDRFDRLLRYVFVNDRFVNFELVYSGNAKAIRYEPDTRCSTLLESAELHASQSSLGLWGLALTLPQPPSTEPPQSASAGSPIVVITRINFDGDVPRVESDEYVIITNNGTASANLQGWRLDADDPGQIFIFPSFDLQPGQSCRVYTNEYHSESCGFSFGIAKAIWNNDGECGRLLDANGILKSEYCY